MRTPRAPRSVRRIAVAAVTPLVILVLLLTAAPSIAAPQHPGGPPQPTWHTAFLTSVARPDLVPGGVNDPSCRPDGRHPAPVVLVNGTLENSYANWSKLAPQLVDDGFCVWSFDYGGATGSPFQQLGPMRASGSELAAFVDRVRRVTGVERVDMVGHSQGGLLPLYYINRLGGETTVRTMVGVAPASRGVGVYSVATLLQGLPAALGRTVLGLAVPAGVDLTAGSTFNQEVARGGYTRPSVRYTTISSTSDGLVTPSEARLPAVSNVDNISIQDLCPARIVDHVQTVYDDVPLRLVRNALAPTDAEAPNCASPLPAHPRPR